MYIYICIYMFDRPPSIEWLHIRCWQRVVESEAGQVHRSYCMELGDPAFLFHAVWRAGGQWAC